MDAQALVILYQLKTYSGESVALGPLGQEHSLTDSVCSHQNPDISGRVQVQPSVKECTKTDAIFDDGSIEENIDIVICYRIHFFLSFP